MGELIQNLSSGEYRLLIVDSIIACFRVDYCGRGELSDRQQKLGAHIKRLHQVAEEFNLVVCVTNQVQSDPGAMAFAGVDGRKSVGGHVLAHAIQTRIMLRKGRGEERVAKLIDSPGRLSFNALFPSALLICRSDCPEGEATYVITGGGINDPDKA